MGLMTAIEQRASLEDPHVPISDGFTLMDIFAGQSTSSGKRVNPNTAKANTAVYAAIQIIAGSISSIPVKLYRGLDNGGKAEERGHPSWGVVHDAPNEAMPAVTFRDAAQGHLLTRGNNYSEVFTNGAGETDALALLDPRTVTLKSDDSGPYYEHRIEGRKRRLPFGKVLHVKGMGFDGRRGWSPIKVAREAIGHGLAIQEYSSRFFENGAVPPGLLIAPESVGSEKRKEWQKSWERMQGGLDNAHRIAVLQGGLEWQEVGFSAEDSQFIQSLQNNWRQVAQIFNVPPHKIRDLTDATFSNIEAQNIEYLQDTLLPWITRWEQEMNLRLLTERERRLGLFFEFVVDGRLRGDSEARSNMIKTRITTGTWTINDVRRMENENPIDLPEADEPMVQMQMVPLSQAASMSVDQRAKLLRAWKGEPEPEPEARTTPEKRTPAMRLRLRDSFRDLFDAASSDLVGREINDIRRFTERFLGDGDPSGFLRVLEGYYFGRDEENEPSDFTGMARQVMGPVFRSYAGSVAGAAAEEIGESDEPDVGGFADEYLEAFIGRYAASSRRQLQKVATEAAQTDDTEPSDAIEGRVSEWSEGAGDASPRQERVSRREVVRLGEAVTKTVWAAAGIMTLRWATVGDSCPYCRQLDGMVASVTKNFVDKNATLDAEGADTPLDAPHAIGHPPAHRGCDCTTRPGS